MPVSAFSTVASENGTKLPSGTAIEGMSPSQINDSIRALMQCVREWYNEGEWIEYGSGDGVVTYTRTGDNSLSIPANVGTQFHTNRRIKVKDGTGTTLYGRITTSTYSSPNTALTIDFDGGATLGSGNPVSVKMGIVSSINTSLPSAVPVGSVVSFAGASAPQGFLICDGSLVSKTTYGELFAILGNTYGTATSTQFYLPNLQSKFPIGKSSSYALGSTGGTFAQTPTGTNDALTFTGTAFTPAGAVSTSVSDTTLTIAQIPSHTHTINEGSTSGTASSALYSSGDDMTTIVDRTQTTSATGGGASHTHTSTSAFTGTETTPLGTINTPVFTGASLDVTNPYISLNYIIKF